MCSPQIYNIPYLSFLHYGPHGYMSNDTSAFLKDLYIGFYYDLQS